MEKDTLYSIHGHKDVILSRKARIVIFGCFGAKMVYFGGENGHFWGFVMIMSVIIIKQYLYSDIIIPCKLSCLSQKRHQNGLEMFFLMSF